MALTAAGPVADKRAGGTSRGAQRGLTLRFWDTSAIIPTLLQEHSSQRLRALTDDDPRLVVWWVTPVECLGAIARRERAHELDPGEAARALETLTALQAAWNEVPPTDAVRDSARRIVRVHDLRTADAFQLAAARVVCDDRPETLPFVTLDERLALAASREGFPLLGLP